MFKFLEEIQDGVDIHIFIINNGFYIMDGDLKDGIILYGDQNADIINDL